MQCLYFELSTLYFRSLLDHFLCYLVWRMGHQQLGVFSVLSFAILFSSPCEMEITRSGCVSSDGTLETLHLVVKVRGQNSKQNTAKQAQKKKHARAFVTPLVPPCHHAGSHERFEIFMISQNFVNQVRCGRQQCTISDKCVCRKKRKRI